MNRMNLVYPPSAVALRPFAHLSAPWRPAHGSAGPAPAAGIEGTGSRARRAGRPGPGGGGRCGGTAGLATDAHVGPHVEVLGPELDGDGRGGLGEHGQRLVEGPPAERAPVGDD